MRSRAPASRPNARPASGEVSAVYRSDQLGTQDRHVLRIARTDIEVALVGAGAAPDADVHEKPEGAKLFESFFHAVENRPLPIRGKFPVLVGGLPFSRVWQIEIFEIPGQGTMAVGPLSKGDGSVLPARVRRAIFNRGQLFGLWFLLGHGYEPSSGNPAALIFARYSSSHSAYVCTSTG